GIDAISQSQCRAIGNPDRPFEFNWRNIIPWRH
ncbi:hypothetical protein ECN1_2774, partial [Escherichia coli N1]